MRHLSVALTRIFKILGDDQNTAANALHVPNPLFLLEDSREFEPSTLGSSNEVSCKYLIIFVAKRIYNNLKHHEDLLQI